MNRARHFPVGLRGQLLLLVGGLLTASVALAQVQLGADIDGEAVADWSGHSVAMSSDGSRVIIGAPLNDGNGEGSGHARVFEFNGANWVQLGADIDGEAERDESGWSVAMSSDGSRVIIGAVYNDHNGEGSGHARVFEFNGANWVQLGADIDGEAERDDSGYSVAMSSDGSRVIIGARNNDGNGFYSGHARVLEFNGANWVQLGADIDGEEAYDFSGFSVATSSDGSRVIIGARFNDGNGSKSGHARVFEFNGANWVQLGTDIDGEATDDWSGHSVAMSSDGSRVIIGAHLNDGNGIDSGHARVFGFNGANWVQLGADIDGEAAGDWFGVSVAMSSDGSRVIIGATYNDGNGNGSGHARVFEFNGANWVQLGADIDGEAAGDFSGFSVATSSDGSRVVIGAPTNDGNGTHSGHARVYTIPKLLDRGNGMIYDPVLDITWLSDANLDGPMTWDDSVAWADNLVFGGFDDWRLPLADRNLDSTIINCHENGISETDCRDNELGYLYYYNLMGSFGDNLFGDQGPFVNIQAVHWTGTEYTFNLAWDFGFVSGDNDVNDKDFESGAWAVRPGDVRTALITYELFPRDVGSSNPGKFMPAPTESPADFGFGSYGAVVHTVNFDVDPFGTPLTVLDLVSDQYASIGVTMNSIPLTMDVIGLNGGPATEPNQTWQGTPGPDQVQIFTFTPPVAAAGIVSTSPNRDLYEFFDESGNLLGSITDSGMEPDDQFQRFVGATVTGGALIKAFKVTGNASGGLELDDLVYEYPGFYTFEFFPEGVGSSSDGKFVAAPTEDPAAFAFGFGGSGVQTVNFDVDPFGTPLAETDLVTGQYASIGVTMDSIPLTTMNTSPPNGGPATEPNQTRSAQPGPDQVQTFTFAPPVAAVAIVSTTPDGDLYEFFDVSGDLLGSITDSGEYWINRLVGGSTTAGALIRTLKVTGAASGGLELDDLIYQYQPVSVDFDSDRIHESIDNCTKVANPDQRDSNGDGFGNACDADINNDCIVNFLDSMVYQDNFFLSGDLDTDNNGDGITNFLDLKVLSDQFFSVPGPGADIACHGSPIYYSISRVIGNGIVIGYIKTDGTIGARTSPVDWLLILDDGHGGIIVLDHGNSYWPHFGMTADEDGLYFDFIAGPLGGHVVLACTGPICVDNTFWVWEMVGHYEEPGLNEALNHLYYDGTPDVWNEISNPAGLQVIGIATESPN